MPHAMDVIDHVLQELKCGARLTERHFVVGEVRGVSIFHYVIPSRLQVRPKMEERPYLVTRQVRPVIDDDVKFPRGGDNILEERSVRLGADEHTDPVAPVLNRSWIDVDAVDTAEWKVITP